MTTSDSFISEYQRLCDEQKRLGQINKTALFTSLAAADIDLVVVAFDGEGDSGQIVSIDAERKHSPVPLPKAKVTFVQAVWGKPEPEISEVDIPEAIESLCYNLLQADNGGWENNDGAFGEFHLNVGANTVELDFNARYTDVATSTFTY